MIPIIKKSFIQIEIFKDSNSLILFFSSFFMVMGVNLISPVLPEIIKYFNISELKAGLIISMFTFPTIILSPVIGGFADSFGRKKILVYGLLAYGISGLIPIFFNNSFNLLLVARTVQGISCAAVMPLTVTLLGDLHEGNKEVTAQGIRAFFNGMGGFLFPVLGGFLAIFSWNFPFFCYSITIPFSFLILSKMPGLEGNINSLENRKFNFKIFIKKFKTIRSFFIFMVLISCMVRFFLYVSLIVYLPILLVNKFSVSLTLAGFVLGIMHFIKMIISLQVGNITGYLGKINALILGFCAYGLAAFLLPFIPGIKLIIIIMVIFGIGDGIISPLQKSLLTQNVASRNRAALISVNASLQNIGKSISPVIAGIIIASYGINWVFWVMTLVTLMPILFFSFKKNEYNT